MDDDPNQTSVETFGNARLSTRTISMQRFIAVAYARA